jgi:hypothetical protein
MSPHSLLTSGEQQLGEQFGGSTTVQRADAYHPGHRRWKGKIKGTARRAFNGLSAHGFSRHAQKLLRAAIDANSMTALVELRATYATVRGNALESTHGIT